MSLDSPDLVILSCTGDDPTQQYKGDTKTVPVEETSHI